MLTVEQFFNKLNKYDFFDKEREWALKHCSDMNEVWNKIKPEWLIKIARKHKVLTEEEETLWAIFCARRVIHLLKGDPDPNEQISQEELTAAEATAFKDAWAAAGDNIKSAAIDMIAEWLRKNISPVFD